MPDKIDRIIITKKLIGLVDKLKHEKTQKVVGYENI